MLTGTDSVLLCARVDFVDDLSSTEVEQACMRLDGALRERFDDLDEIFIEPVPRNDPQVRATVGARYGDVVASWRAEHDAQVRTSAAREPQELHRHRLKPAILRLDPHLHRPPAVRRDH